MNNTINTYKHIIKQLLQDYEDFGNAESHIDLIFDDERMRYMAVWVGWRQYKRLHQCAIHIDIVGDSIMIQCNDTEESIINRLVEMGVSPDKISLGFIHPHHQQCQETMTEPVADVVSVGNS
ncbi:MAG TPA: XisI protein [Oscillatoriaceae cyanobacterium M33_DOE_052]|uniref:XisI protein n=1 Tax=Planktothricoides sp. SpSt-374 TaxID=2282167 RepID=A0A7C3ZFF2_9CYAN|nr:XisI protein [Oscillatoriaceae cyanobacterium M33_DOE_052]